MADEIKPPDLTDEFEGLGEIYEVDSVEELPEDEFPGVEYVGQVGVGNRACIGGTAYIDVWMEIRPGSGAHVYLAIAFFNSSGGGAGGTGLMGPYGASSSTARYIGRRLSLRLSRRSAAVQGLGAFAGTPTWYRSPRYPFYCGPWS